MYCIHREGTETSQKKHRRTQLGAKLGTHNHRAYLHLDLQSHCKNHQEQVAEKALRWLWIKRDDTWCCVLISPSWIALVTVSDDLRPKTPP